MASLGANSEKRSSGGIYVCEKAKEKKAVNEVAEQVAYVIATNPRDANLHTFPLFPIFFLFLSLYVRFFSLASILSLMLSACVYVTSDSFMAFQWKNHFNIIDFRSRFAKTKVCSVFVLPTLLSES